MRWIVGAMISFCLLAVVSSPPAYSKNATRPACLNGYAPLGAICISASNGDIVLPVVKTADASAPAKAR